MGRRFGASLAAGRLMPGRNFPISAIFWLSYAGICVAALVGSMA